MKQHKLRINGKEVSSEEFHKNGPIGGRGAPGVAQGYGEGNPGKSIAMSIHPSQAGMLNAEMKARGIQGVEWNEQTGRCTITSRRGRAQAMPVFGKLVHMENVRDCDGGYGDG